MAEESYPEDLRYHSEHDWARIEGDGATFGITWYAQDALGEVVFFEPPEIGARVTKDSGYTEVESVKAVSDVIAPPRATRSSPKSRPTFASTASSSFRLGAPSRKSSPTSPSWRPGTPTPRPSSASSAPGCTTTTCRRSLTRSPSAPSSSPRTPRTSPRCRRVGCR